MLDVRSSFTARDYAIRYSLEFVVIVLGIFLSFHFQEIRDHETAIEMKNEVLGQLIMVIDDDLTQINAFIDLQGQSLRHANALLSSSPEQPMSGDSAMRCLSHVGRALRSFFPQQGVFNQIVSSDLVEVIDSPELKARLFKLYNEDLLRHAVHTLEYDQFFLPFNRSLTKEFFLDDAWGSQEGEEVMVEGYRSNPSYLYGDQLKADLLEARSSMRNYIQELKYLKEEFTMLRELSISETHGVRLR